MLAVAAAAVLLARIIYQANPVVAEGWLGAALVMASLGVFADLLVYQLPRSAVGSISFIPYLSAAILAPSWITLLAVCLAQFVGELLRRNPVVKALFNISQIAVAISVGMLAYRGLGGESLLAAGAVSLSAAASNVALPGLALVVVYFGINSTLVNVAIALSERRSFLELLRHNSLSMALYDLLACPVVFFMGWLYVRSGAAGAFILAVPLFGVRQLYKTNLQLEQSSQDLLELMVKAIEARDPYTSGHSRRVAHYSRLIARTMGLSAREIDRIATAALLHDVGKIHEVFAPILRKPDRLTPDEWAIMQTHPIKSAELVATVSQLRDLVAPVRHHHENWDGTGYPDGIAGEAIPLASRVIIFADTIDAMTTDRPYRAAMGETEVRAELIKCRGSQFDPEICDKLLASPLFSLLFAPDSRETTPQRVRSITPARGPRIAVGA
ncbi:MAG TPA: HD-GYP domain-containing protein [Candidatus Paceibacterota bacterium]|nr:HD-GYP domain-containing protein [Candidatus Paceibacterota bacterium]